MTLSCPISVTVCRVLDLVLTWLQQQLCGYRHSAKPTALINCHPIQIYATLKLPVVCRSFRDNYHTLIRPPVVSPGAKLQSHGLFDSLNVNDLATTANASYHRVDATRRLLKEVADTTYGSVSQAEFSDHLKSMDGKCKNDCKDDLKRSMTKTALALAQINAYELCEVAMSPIPQTNPSMWSGCNWGCFFSTSFNQTDGQKWTLQCASSGVVPHDKDFSWPRTAKPGTNGRLQKDRIFQVGTLTPAMKKAQRMGYSLRSLDANATVVSPPITQRVISIEVLVRIGNNPEQGAFSGVVESVFGVHNAHSKTAIDGRVMALARRRAKAGICELQVFSISTS